VAAPGITNDPVGIAKECIALVQPRLMEMGKVLGVYLLPLACLQAVAGFLPFIAQILALVASLGYLVFYALLGSGSAAEYAMRLAAGAPITPGQAWSIQKGRMMPFLIGLFVPGLIAGIGCLITVILFGLFLLPVYMIEQKKGFDVNRRSLDISGKNWGLAIVPSLIIAIPAAIVSSIITVALGFIPYLNVALLPLFNACYQALLLPTMLVVQFRVYFAILRQHENTDAAATVRARPVA
jgi:hypothetical protein